MDEDALAVAMRADLERRVAEVSSPAERDGLGKTEWLLVVTCAVVVPLILWWRFG
jgi:hypothetical protein